MYNIDIVNTIAHCAPVSQVKWNWATNATGGDYLAFNRPKDDTFAHLNFPDEIGNNRMRWSTMVYDLDGESGRRPRLVFIGPGNRAYRTSQDGIGIENCTILSTNVTTPIQQVDAGSGGAPPASNGATALTNSHIIFRKNFWVSPNRSAYEANFPEQFEPADLWATTTADFDFTDAAAFDYSLGAGSQELLKVAVWGFTNSARHLVTATPTFENVTAAARRMGHPVVEVKVDGQFRLDLRCLEDGADECAFVAQLALLNLPQRA
jgi:hypothetical protein